VLARHRTGLADGQVADIWHRLGVAARALGDDKKAENALRRALERDPLHEPTLQALVDLAGQKGDWKTVVESKRALLEGARDELGDAELAVERFAAALDEVATTPKAFEAIDKIYTERKDWKNLARAYRKHLKRLGDDAPPERLLEMWTRLGDVCLDHLGDTE